MLKNIRVSKISVISVVIAIFGIVTVILGIEAASYGAKLALLEEKVFELDVENRSLSGQLVNETSTKELSQISEEKGFVKPTNIVYINHGTVSEAFVR